MRTGTAPAWVGTGRGSRCRAHGRSRDPVDELVISRVTLTGSRACGRCPEPCSWTSSPPVSSASRRPRARGWQRSSVPCTTSVGHPQPRTGTRASVPGRGGSTLPLGDHRLGVGVSSAQRRSPRTAWWSAARAAAGRRRTRSSGGNRRHAARTPGCAWSAGRRVDLLRHRRSACMACRGRVPARYPDRLRRPGDPVGVLGRQPQRPARRDSARRQRTGRHRRHPDGQQVRDDLGRRMALRVTWPV